MAKHPAFIEDGERALADPTKSLSDQPAREQQLNDVGSDVIIDDAPGVVGDQSSDR